MPSTSTLALFAVAALALIIVPGPNVMYIVTRGITQGRAAALVSSVGVQTGALVHVAAAALGLSALVLSSSTAFNLVKYAGAAYLIVLGIRTLLSRPGASVQMSAPVVRPRRLFGQGFLISALNPKVALFYLAFFPQFLDPARGSVAVQTLVLGGVFVLIAIVCDSIWALLAGSFGAWLRQQPTFLRAQHYVAGGVYLALGLGAAATSPGGGHK
jgi:threonine/homoserine/homoserine lactone efflux protein